MDGHNSEDTKESTADMSAFVQDLLQQMVSLSLTCNALDDMGSRINDLEQSINDLKTEMGMEGSPSPVVSSKPNADDMKPEEGSA
uniref:Heat shock factor-binding protein 1-like n=1 Tax=Cannabis sativa TaxID=3483 RepID=A0A803NQL7_CANSA